MPKISIDGRALEVADGLTIMQAADSAGIQIPRFCYHPAFVPEGSCRMCLVEIEGLPKLELACSTVVRDGMKVSTSSEKVMEARRGVLEFLLAEHPLDCPICDKAGECLLQDYYDTYGRFKGDFKEVKETREKKLAIGKSLILDRERCILCTRCVRFLTEVTKTQELGVFKRGVHSEISPYENEMVGNNYSGNLVEICPVGAITDLDFRFKTRPWFLNTGESICPLCSRGCNIFIDYLPGFVRVRGTKKVMRVRARENMKVNGCWICDRGRYGYTELDRKRWEEPAMNQESRQTGVTWEKALTILADKIRSLAIRERTSRIVVLAQTYLTNEELFLLRKLFREDLKVERVLFVDPPPGTGDELLLTPERTPNGRGAREIGFDLNPPTLETVVGGTELLLDFGSFLHDRFGLTGLKTALDRVAAKFLFTPRVREQNAFFDFVLPTAMTAEKEGSLTNVDGRVQEFRAALGPRGESLPEWRLLVNLGKELRSNYRYYARLGSPPEILGQMAEEIPFFAQER